MRIVVKVGTKVIAGETGLSKTHVVQIVSEIAELRRDGHEVILVASGAAQAGAPKLPHLDSPFKKKIWQAMGNPILMESYTAPFERLGFHAGQVLILRNNFTSHEGFENLVNMLEALLKAKVVPILNENDPTKTDDLTLGDNDILSAMIAVAMSADKLIILTKEGGLYTDNPNKNKEAKLIEAISDIDFEVERLSADDEETTSLGGMFSKIQAAKHAVSCGIEVFIGNGRKKGVLKSAFEKDFHGTRFVPKIKPTMSHKRRWMMAAKGTGVMTIDDGAVKAIASGKSLLLPGIVSLNGDFKRGEVIEIISKAGQAIAYGKVNYPAKDIHKAMNKKKESVEIGLRVLEREVIHRNYMVILSRHSTLLKH